MQMISAVDDYLTTHPAERHNRAALLVWRAVAETTWE